MMAADKLYDPPEAAGVLSSSDSMSFICIGLGMSVDGYFEMPLNPYIKLSILSVPSMDYGTDYVYSIFLLFHSFKLVSICDFKFYRSSRFCLFWSREFHLAAAVKSLTIS